MKKIFQKQDNTSVSRDDNVTVPVVDEEVHVDKQVTEGDKVQVSKASRTVKETVEADTIHEEVEVKRVPVGRPIEEPALTRKEGDVTIVPVMEEVVTVTKKLVLTEEIHLTRKKITRTNREEIELRKESADIKKVNRAGQ